MVNPFHFSWGGGIKARKDANGWKVSFVVLFYTFRPWLHEEIAICGQLITQICPSSGGEEKVPG